MLARLMPPRLDNDYRGWPLALWVFGLTVAVILLQCAMSIFDAASTARTADGIALGTYGPSAAQTVVALFALLGFARLMLLLVCMVVLVRYRSAVPGMFAVLLISRLGAKTVLYFLPIARIGRSPAGIVNFVLLGLLVVGFVTSLVERRPVSAPRVSRPIAAT